MVSDGFGVEKLKGLALFDAYRGVPAGLPVSYGTERFICSYDVMYQFIKETCN